jgi:hypothetical protein
VILFPPLIVSVITIGFTYFALVVARYCGGSRAVWVVGALLLAVLAYELVDAKLFCDAPPKFIPPSCSDANSCGDGQVIFNCDAPFGAGDYLMIYVFGPLTAILIPILTYVVGRQQRQKGLAT